MITFKHDSENLSDAIGISKDAVQNLAKDVLRKLQLKYIDLEAYQPFTEQEELMLCVMFLQDCEYTAETYLRSIIGKEVYETMRRTQSRMIEAMYKLYPQSSELIEICVAGDAIESVNKQMRNGDESIKELLKKLLS